MTSLRVMTYNVNLCQGRCGRSDPERVLQVIADAAPDLLALQAIDGNAQLSELAERLGMHAYAVAGSCGNAFLSSYPLRGVRAFTLGDAGSCLQADVDLDQKRLQLFNVQISPDHPRREQIAALLSEELLGSPRLGSAKLVLGDFGDHLWGDGNWRLMLALRRVSKPLASGTYPAFFPLVPRDRAYVQGDVRVLDTKVVRGQAARHASTHLPFLLTVQLVDPRRALPVTEPLTNRRLEIAHG